jgi:hypothetical protein
METQSLTPLEFDMRRITCPSPLRYKLTAEPMTMNR